MHCYIMKRMEYISKNKNDFLYLYPQFKMTFRLYNSDILQNGIGNYVLCNNPYISQSNSSSFLVHFLWSEIITDYHISSQQILNFNEQHDFQRGNIYFISFLHKLVILMSHSVVSTLNKKTRKVLYEFFWDITAFSVSDVFHCFFDF